MCKPSSCLPPASARTSSAFCAALGLEGAPELAHSEVAARLLETKELDFGCQFVLTFYTVCLKLGMLYTDLNWDERFLAVLLLSQGMPVVCNANWAAFCVAQRTLSR